MLSYHSVLIGVNAGHSYVCEVYERILAEVAPDGIVYREKRVGERVILGVTVGERILDHRRASISRVAAVVYAVFDEIRSPYSIFFRYFGCAL